MLARNILRSLCIVKNFSVCRGPLRGWHGDRRGGLKGIVGGGRGEGRDGDGDAGVRVWRFGESTGMGEMVSVIR